MTAVLEAPATRATPDFRVATLFEVIGEMQDAFGPEADEHVVAAVMRLLQTGQMTFLRPQRVARALEDASSVAV
jgi:hypothetical protein